MTTIQDVLMVAQQLTPVEQLEVIQVLSRGLQQRYASENIVSSPPGRRVLGLDAGHVWMSDDFDAELPDSFWLGTDQ